MTWPSRFLDSAVAAVLQRGAGLPEGFAPPFFAAVLQVLRLGQEVL
jgi:hypothetical protein